MDTPPPLPSPVTPAPPPRFFHHTATASIASLLLAILIGIALTLLRPLLPPPWQAIMGVILGLLSLLLFLAAFITGIIALCGIPRHGAKGLLARGLCGALIPLFLTALAIPSLIATTTNIVRAQAAPSQPSPATVQAELAHAVKEVNKGAPTMVDEETRLDGADALPDGRLAYKYTLISLLRADISADAFVAALQPEILNAYKNRPEMKYFRDHRIGLVYQYRDKAGDLITEISVGPSDL